MRVLHVIPAVATRYGGPSAAIVPMCLSLSAYGLESLIATTDADGPTRLRVPIGERTMWQGVPAIFFGKTFSESFKYSPALAAWLSLNVRGFEVVHIHGVLSHACLAAAAACRRHSVPYVVRPLGTLAPWSLEQKALRKRLLLALGGMRLLRKAAGLHCTSTEEKSSLEARFQLSGGLVVPLGVDAEILATPLVAAADRDRDRYVLALCRIHPKKNLEALIHAFTTTVQPSARWRLIIAGAGAARYVGALQRLVGELRAADRVRFVGWVDGEHKRELIRHASLFALPSRHENFGVAVLEALAAGVPALLSRHVDLAHDVEHSRAGWVVDGSRESIGEALGAAIADDAERQARSVAARELAGRFAWPAVAIQLKHMYEQVQQQRSIATASSLLSPNA